MLDITTITTPFRLSVVRRLKVLAMMGLIQVLLMASARAQESVCADPVDKPCFDCLTQVAQYTSGMVISNRAGAPARLQSAIDNAYKDVQNDWTGRLRERMWIRTAYFTGTGALLLFLLVAALIRLLVRPRLWPDQPPSWKVEKVTLLLMLIGFTVIICGERWWTWQAMLASYERLAAAVRPFVHLRPPIQSANTESNPCSQYWSETDPMLQQCEEDWRRAAGKATVRYKESHFTTPELLNDVTSVGITCRNATLPTWWTNPSLDPGRRLVGSQCVLLQNGSDAVTFQDVASLPTLPKWLEGKEGDVAALELEPLFRRSNTSGGNIYQTKVTRLLGSDGFRYYKDNYKFQSALWCGLPLLAMYVGGVVILIGRHRELSDGSIQWARTHRLVARWLGAAGTCVLVLVIVVSTFQ